MGLNYQWAKRIIQDRQNNLIPGARVVTLGRQFFNLGEREFAGLLAKYGIINLEANEIILGEHEAGVWNRLKEEGRFYRPGYEKQTIITDDLFFLMIGFEEVIAVDISDFQHANCVFDMNTTGILEKLGSPADLVVDAGSMEHYFHIPNAFQNIFDALKIGGRVYHMSPTNNHPEHGLFQFSATMFNDYYTANNYQIHRLEFVEAAEGSDVVRPIYLYFDYDFEQHYPGGNNVLNNRTLLTHVLAEKTPQSTYGVMPIQRKYQLVHEK